MIPCNGIHILPARSEPVAEATRARAGERRLSRRRGDATHGERRTTVLGDPTREAPPGDHGGAMATSGSHRAQPFAGRGRCERRRTKRDPGERCQGAAARATPRVAGVPPISGTHRPQGRLLRPDPLGVQVEEVGDNLLLVSAEINAIGGLNGSVERLVRRHQLGEERFVL